MPQPVKHKKGFDPRVPAEDSNEYREWRDKKLSKDKKARKNYRKYGDDGQTIDEWQDKKSTEARKKGKKFNVAPTKKQVTEQNKNYARKKEGKAREARKKSDQKVMKDFAN